MKRPGPIKLIQLALLCLGLLVPKVVAQAPLSNLVVTLGTTTNNWSFVVIGSEESQLLQGKEFAVYGKTGYPTNAGAYTFRANIFQQSNPTTINTLLNEGVSVGDNLTTLSSALENLFSEPNTNLTNPHYLPGFNSLPLPQQVQTAFQVAASDPSFADTIGLLAHMHPGLLLCLGQAFAEVITNVTTYEIREVNPATSLAAEVVGRVTVVPGNPVILPAPGEPFQVTTTSSTDNLRIRLRWGTSDAFRRLSLLSFGFDVWRMPASTAVSLGYNVTPPTPAQLRGGGFVQANMTPVIATKDYSTGSGAGAANDPADGTTYFFSDNNGRPLGYILPTTNAIPADYTNIPPFYDGEQFYYFIAARDILGRDGFVSPGGLAEACRRIPPAQTTNVAVQNTFHVVNAATLANQQFLTVTWQQDLVANDQVSQYWVYRWPDPSIALTNDNAGSNYIIAVVNQIPGSPTNYYQDKGPGAPTVSGPTNYWYTVRAVSQAACGPLLSPQSSAVWGVLRERVGPAAASGELMGNCGSPAVVFQSFQTYTNTVNPSFNYFSYELTVQRLDPGTAWAEFFLTNAAGIGTTIGPVYFPPGNGPLEIPYSTMAFSFSNMVTNVTCVVGSQWGLVSAPVSVMVTNTSYYNLDVQPVFLAGQVLVTSLSLTNPLLPAITSGGCLPAQGATAYPDGTVRMAFNYAGPTPIMLIQAQSNNVWVAAGVAMADSHGNYSIYYPACLLGPLPNFQGCPLNLPSEGDCSQHISAGAAGGAVGQVQITFTLTPGTAEFRLYRSVNNGPLTLIAQGPATYSPTDTNATVVRNDDAMPPSQAELCYYVQLLDVYGNAGPLAFLGCKDNKPAQLPTPALSQPQVAGINLNPQVNLTWFCPTSGVYRFEILVQRTDHPGIVPLSFSASNLTPSPAYNVLSSFFGLLDDPTALAQFDAAFYTPPNGVSFGPGPQFTLTADVITNATYSISVAAMDDQGNAGPPSKAWQFTWRPSAGPTPVPWPARPLPAANAFDDTPPPSSTIQPRVAAVLLYSNSILDSTYPVGIRIGDLGPVVVSSPQYNLNVGATNPVSYIVILPTFFAGPPPPPADPNNLIFQRLSQNPERNGNPLLPIVVYRQQVANAAYPNVSGAMIQVTPLIEHLAYGVSGAGGYPTITIYDLLIAGGTEVSGSKTGTFLYLRDQQPLLLGARYQYFVVRLNAQREIAEIIPAGTVTIPTTP